MTEPKDSARAYARIRYRLLLVDLAVWLVFLIGVQGFGLSHGFATWWARVTEHEPLVILGYLACFGLLHYLVTLPLHFYSSFLLEHRFRLSRLTLPGWLTREAKHVAVSAVIGTLLVEGLYAILRQYPAHWPLVATMGWVGFSVVLARVFPTVLLPIFYKTTPVEEEPLVRRVRELCQRAGLAVLGVCRFQLGAETRKANAVLAGLGKTRRVLLSDTLMAEFTPEEIAGVLAHELGHQRYRHITKLLALSGVGSLAAFFLVSAVGPLWVEPLGLDGLTDIAGFPILMMALSLIGLVGLPIQNAISRAFEWQADRFAVAITKLPPTFAEALRKLGELNLADPNPPRWVVWWFYDHPPLAQRIAAAQAAGG